MKKLLIPIVALALLSAGCDDIPGGQDLPEELSGLKITASASIWGTETALQKNDKLGFFAGAPFNEDNLLLTVGDGNELTTSKELKWQPDSLAPTSVRMVAYTPYSSAYSGGKGTFSVKANQTSDAAVKASDLMMAASDIRFSTKEVDLVFSHKMVRIALYFDNATGKKISAVELDNAILGTGVDFLQAAVYEDTLSFSPAKVKMAPFVSKSGAQYYAAIVAPQSVRLSTTVTFSDGGTSSFALPREQRFASGQQWDNADSPIVLSEQTGPREEPAAFEISISPWAGGDELQFER